MNKYIGEIFLFAVQPPPSGTVECGGQALSRTKYCDLFRVIGTAYGTGDGSTTFNVPDLRERVPAGPRTMGGQTLSEPRLSGTISGGVSGAAVGNTGGNEGHSLAANELLTLTTIGDFRGTDPGNLADGNYEGEADAHNNVQPTIIIPFVIYTGVFD